jgi:predicted lipid-binding transport protein (Tim44 family)
VLSRLSRLRRRWLVGACVLAMATGAGAQSDAQRRPAAPGLTAPGQPPAAGTTAANPARAHGWWLAALGGLGAVLGLVALAARRARLGSAAAPPYAEGWQGIGGPSYAPQPTTVRIEPRSAGRPEAPRINGQPEARPRRETLRRAFGVPADFDAPAFLDGAKQSFVRLQSAWDRSDLHELDKCTTDEMFSALTHELRVRAGPSRTEVIDLTASLLAIETAAGEHRASVRFSGSLKVNGEDERLDEVWNLSRPVDGASGWLLAGIQQLN